MLATLGGLSLLAAGGFFFAASTARMLAANPGERIPFWTAPPARPAKVSRLRALAVLACAAAGWTLSGWGLLTAGLVLLALVPASAIMIARHNRRLLG